MHEQPINSLLGQTSALMMVVVELIERLPPEEIEEIKTRVRQRLDRHPHDDAMVDVFAGANDMLRRIFMGRPEEF
ncbi:MAG: hypothetical protein ACK43M_14600 [Allorhizobium sp.]